MTEANTNGLELSKLRGELAAIDRVLVDALGRRYLLAREDGRLKREAGVEILDPAQEAEVLRRAAELAREKGIEEEEGRNIFWCILDLSRNAQRELERRGSITRWHWTTRALAPHVEHR